MDSPDAHHRVDNLFGIGGHGVDFTLVLTTKVTKSTKRKLPDLGSLALFCN
jgi:hypothetical protein